MSRFTPACHPLPKAVYGYFSYLRSLKNLSISSQSYSKSAFQKSFLQNNIAENHSICRGISFFSKKKFKDEAEEILKEKGEEGGSVTIFQEEEAAETALTEQQIEWKRNKSRLKPQHYRILHGEKPYDEARFWTHHTVAYKRRMFGIFGEKSDVNPGLCWPTKEDLADRLEYEKVAYPFTIQEMKDAVAKKRRLEKEEFERRTKEVERNMELVDGIKAQIMAKKEAKEKELRASQERKEKLMDEVRRHFGYTVDPKDERFQEMLQKKEKEQRKQMKEARKLEKQNKQLEKLAQETELSKKKAEKLKKKAEEEDDDD